MKNEKPIIFSTDMVKAILDGRKTQTRRTQGLETVNKGIVECSYLGILTGNYTRTIVGFKDIPTHYAFDIECPYGKPGDLLWVRETWAMYLDGFLTKSTNSNFFKGVKWKPSIHMKKVYAQIWLEITDIRVERLQEISHEDAKNEGIKSIGENCEGATIFRNYADPADYVATGELSTRMSFRSLWDSINSKVTWLDNPWVWVISFKVLSTSGKPERKEIGNG